MSALAADKQTELKKLDKVMPFSQRKTTDAEVVESLRRRSSFLIIGILALSLGLRLAFLSQKSLWIDEAWSIGTARLPWMQMWWSAIHQDPNMSVYQVLLHVWMWIGQTEFWIRTLSVIFGVANVWTVVLLGTRIFNRATGLIASFLVTINVFHIQYSQEARAYSLVTLLVTVSTIFLLKAVEEPKRWHWLLYSITAILAIYSHAFAVLVICAHFIFLLIYHFKTLYSKRALASFIGIAASSLPLVYALYLRSKDPFVPLDWLHKISIHDVSDIVSSLAGRAEYKGSPDAKSLVVCSLIPGTIVFAAWVRKSRLSWRSREETSMGLLLLWLFIPIILLVGLSIVRPIVVNRYFLFCVPALALIVAHVWTVIKRRWLSTCLLVALLIFSVLHIVSYYRYRLGDGEWMSATRYVLAKSKPGDGIFFVVAPGRLLFDYYHHRYYASSQSVPEVVYPETTDIRSDPAALRYLPELHQALLDATTVRYPRVWVVLYHDSWPATRPVSSRLVDSMTSAYYAREEEKFNQVTVMLFSEHRPLANKPAN